MPLDEGHLELKIEGKPGSLKKIPSCGRGTDKKYHITISYRFIGFVKAAEDDLDFICRSAFLTSIYIFIA